MVVREDGALRGLLLLGYGPAIAWLGWQVFVAESIALKVLAGAIFLLSWDLWWMAGVDLLQAEAVRSQLALSNQAQSNQTDERLVWFRRVTIATIVVELVGLYGCGWSLFLGAIGVLISQVGFNLLAGVKLQPEELEQSEKIVPFGIGDRAIVLVADFVGIVLLGVGIAGIAPMGMAIGLLVMVLVYLGVKARSER